MAQPVVGEMEMHSVANLATLQTPVATFSLQKSAQTLFSFWEFMGLPREHEVLLSQCAPLSLSLSVRLLCSASGGDEQHIQLNTDIMLLASLILLASIAEITARLFSLSYVYLILSDNENFCAD